MLQQSVASHEHPVQLSAVNSRLTDKIKLVDPKLYHQGAVPPLVYCLSDSDHHFIGSDALKQLSSAARLTLQASAARSRDADETIGQGRGVERRMVADIGRTSAYESRMAVAGEGRPGRTGYNGGSSTLYSGMGSALRNTSTAGSRLAGKMNSRSRVMESSARQRLLSSSLWGDAMAISAVGKVGVEIGSGASYVGGLFKYDWFDADFAAGGALDAVEIGVLGRSQSQQEQAILGDPHVRTDNNIAHRSRERCDSKSDLLSGYRLYR